MFKQVKLCAALAACILAAAAPTGAAITGADGQSSALRTSSRRRRKTETYFPYAAFANLIDSADLKQKMKEKDIECSHGLPDSYAIAVETGVEMRTEYPSEFSDPFYKRVWADVNLQAALAGTHDERGFVLAGLDPYKSKLQHRQEDVARICAPVPTGQMAKRGRFRRKGIGHISWPEICYDKPVGECCGPIDLGYDQCWCVKPELVGCSTPDWGTHFVNCGRHGKCGNRASDLVENSEKHALRCCMDTPPITGRHLSGWRPTPKKTKNKNRGHSIQTVYGESDNFDTQWKSCKYKLTYNNAKGFCEKVGARLCTRSELDQGVAVGTGCGHDNRMVWTSDTDLKSADYEALAEARALTDDAGSEAGDDWYDEEAEDQADAQASSSSAADNRHDDDHDDDALFTVVIVLLAGILVSVWAVGFTVYRRRDLSKSPHRPSELSMTSMSSASAIDRTIKVHGPCRTESSTSTPAVSREVSAASTAESMASMSTI